jgi:hypothetical protein
MILEPVDKSGGNLLRLNYVSTAPGYKSFIYTSFIFVIERERIFPNLLNKWFHESGK